jgi:hypothetical protein
LFGQEWFPRDESRGFDTLDISVLNIAQFGLFFSMKCTSRTMALSVQNTTRGGICSAMGKIFKGRFGGKRRNGISYR